MRIKIAILDNDVSYLERFTSTFSEIYSEKLEIYSFSNMQNALTTLDSKKVDVFLASEEFELDMKAIPKRCGFAYLVEDNDTQSFENRAAVGKFQKAELIYKQILGIYSENSSKIIGRKASEENNRIITFSSPVGGVGTSTLAIACAKELAAANRKVLYLCLETFGVSDLFFHDEGNQGMSDVIFALKSQKNNLSLRIESCIKRDNSGVCFFSAPMLALDIMELNGDEIIELLDALADVMNFDAIIIDKPFSITPDDIKVLNKSSVVVLASDGTEISNIKVKRGVDALNAIEQELDESLISKLQIVYNKFSNKSGALVEDTCMPVIGGVVKYVNASFDQIVEEIKSKKLFSKLFEQEIY